MQQIWAPQSVKKALSRLQAHGFQAYAVGGAVRDALLGRKATDWDITTSALPQEISAVFSDCRQVEVGKKHGVITVLFEGIPLEITTFRADGAYLDARHPVSVRFSETLKEDVQRRDFTVNTLCWSPQSGVVDLCGGLADLDKKCLRAVGNPEQRFQEDALRILRALRFSATLGFSLEEETAQAVLKYADLLHAISQERIRDEFTRLLQGDCAAEVLLRFADVIAQFIPELSPLLSCTQPTPYHCYDAYEHTVRAVAAIESTPILRLTMFFHDFAKPLCKKVDANGTAHFKGHQAAGAKLVRPILQRLRYDKKTVQEVTYYISIHDLSAPKTKVEAKLLLSEIGLPAYRNLIKIKRADQLAKANPHALDEQLAGMEHFLTEITENGECFSLQNLAVNGNTLKALGVQDGLQIKADLDFLLHAVLTEACPNKESALLFYLQQKKPKPTV